MKPGVGWSTFLVPACPGRCGKEAVKRVFASEHSCYHASYASAVLGVVILSVRHTRAL